MSDLKFITENGEVTFCPETKKYQVWDCTYSEVIYVADSEELAFDFLSAYGNELDKESQGG